MSVKLFFKFNTTTTTQIFLSRFKFLSPNQRNVATSLLPCSSGTSPASSRPPRRHVRTPRSSGTASHGWLSSIPRQRPACCAAKQTSPLRQHQSHSNRRKSGTDFEMSRRSTVYALATLINVGGFDMKKKKNYKRWRHAVASGCIRARCQTNNWSDDSRRQDRCIKICLRLDECVAWILRICWLAKF